MAFLPYIYNPNASPSVIQLPMPTLEWSETRTFRNELATQPSAHGAMLLDQSMAPVRIDIRGLIVGWASENSVTVTAARNALVALENALQGHFWLLRYTDESWNYCVLQSFTVGRDHHPDDVMEYSLSVIALSPTRTYSGSGIEEGPTGWDYGPDDGGIPTGDGGTGDEVTPPMEYNQPIAVLFSGLPDDTPPGGVGIKRYVPGTAGAALSVARLGVAGVGQSFGTGTTTIRVAKAPRGSEVGAYMELALDDSATNGVTTTGAFAVTPGDYLYFTVSGAVHSDILVYADVEAD